MKAPFGYCALLGSALLLAGCGSSHSLLAERKVLEAQDLRGTSPKGGKGEAHLSRAEKLKSEGEDEEAFGEAETAIWHFRLASARAERDAQRRRLEELQAETARDQDQLNTFQEILREMKSEKKNGGQP